MAAGRHPRGAELTVDPQQKSLQQKSSPKPTIPRRSFFGGFAFSWKSMLLKCSFLIQITCSGSYAHQEFCLSRQKSYDFCYGIFRPLFKINPDAVEKYRGGKSLV